MHPFFHSFKRAHWSSMRFARNWAEEYDLTPARFEMLLAIGRDPTGIAQNVLRRVLDVCAPVVSRMLKSLEETGFVTRRKHPADGRTNLVTLTLYGEGVLDVARKDLLDDGLLEHELRKLLSSNPFDLTVTERIMKRTRAFLTFLRESVYDASTLVFPAYLSSGERSPEYPLRPYPQIALYPPATVRLEWTADGRRPSARDFMETRRANILAHGSESGFAWWERSRARAREKRDDARRARR